jgi:hypothetical protein
MLAFTKATLITSVCNRARGFSLRWRCSVYIYGFDGTSTRQTSLSLNGSPISQQQLN